MFNGIFHGIQPFFWIGCVEQRDDSKSKDKYMLGRVRVRVLGFHSPELAEDNMAGEGIPVDKLPWAYPINSINSASVSGLGVSPTGVVPGTWVIGIALDGPSMQDLYYIGTLAGVPQKITDKNNKGFRDPETETPGNYGKYPRESGNAVYPEEGFIDEEDLNRLARGINSGADQHPMLKKKAKDRTKNIETASGHLSTSGATWNEPESAYDAKYPFNHVYESESGHIREIDDTPGNRRSHEWHPAGTYTEISDDGSKVQKIVGQDFEIVLKNKHVCIKGNLNITVESNANILVKGDCNIDVHKNASMQAKDNMILNAEKTMVISGKDVVIVSDNSTLIAAGGPLTARGANTNPSDVATGIL